MQTSYGLDVQTRVCCSYSSRVMVCSKAHPGSTVLYVEGALFGSRLLLLYFMTWRLGWKILKRLPPISGNW
jgi:hypothetical protein